MGGPKIEKVGRSSQATPLAEDVLSQLQGALAQGAFGQGVGPLQREAGTAIRQFLISLQNRAAGIGSGSSQLLDAVSKRSQEFTNRQAAGLRDVFGAAGARFGSQVVQGEGDLRRGAATDFAETSARTLLSEQALLDQLIPAVIGQQFQMGSASLTPFLQMAALGILPEEIIASPGVGQQILSGVTQGAAAFLGGPGGQALFAGGGGDGGGTAGLNVVQNVTPNFGDPNLFAGAAPGMASGFMPPAISPFAMPGALRLPQSVLTSPIVFR